ncbi:MAG TPA: right-handed parallel beta-helix repeat-containing protein [Burkholderiales bacterium]|jgi:parallel beta-helix repeat protein|nr:right-handed parallel beta-helix repeat-containing protein [Burkholderiales bacterium]
MKASHRYACALGALTLVLNSTAQADSDRDRDRDRSKDRTTTVDCASGDTVTRALTRGDDRKSLTILINGICTESVVINRSDIKLAAAAPGATLVGPDGTIDVIRVTGSRVTIDGITVTGGRNGITADSAAGLIVQNALVQGTGRSGIVYAHGASGTVDSVVVTGNARDGIAVDAASAAVINSQVTQNTRHGVGVFTNGSARIGLDYLGNAGGNTISANGFAGIHIVFGSAGVIAMNQVTGNGTSADPIAIRAGINVTSATADIIGGNTISGNLGPGVNLVRSTAIFADPQFGFSTANTVSGNGTPTAQGGVVAFLGSSVTIRDATISGNTGSGVTLSLNSSAQIASTTIQNNLSVGPGTGHGVLLQLGSSLLSSPPTAPGSVSGNAGFGLFCDTPESSAVGSLGIGANGLGAVSCTGF